MTPNERLWQQYYAAVKAGRKAEAAQLLKQLHSTPRKPRATGGGCSRCKKRWT